MSERDAGLLLQDMVEAIDRIASYVDGLTYEEFAESPLISDAVLRNLAVLGEAAQRVPDAVRIATTQIEWTRIIRSRHIVVHNYFGVDYQIVWRILQVHLPPLRTALQDLLDLLP